MSQFYHIRQILSDSLYVEITDSQGKRIGLNYQPSVFAQNLQYFFSKGRFKTPPTFCVQLCTGETLEIALKATESELLQFIHEGFQACRSLSPAVSQGFLPIREQVRNSLQSTK